MCDYDEDGNQEWNADGYKGLLFQTDARALEINLYPDDINTWVARSSDYSASGEFSKDSAGFLLELFDWLKLGDVNVLREHHLRFNKDIQTKILTGRPREILSEVIAASAFDKPDIEGM